MRWQTLYEGRWIFGILALLTAVSWVFLPWLATIFALLILFCINFFRDPDRPVPADPGAIVSAADGTVTEVVEMEEPETLRVPMKRIGIFLSVFDVHTNRAPIDARVTYSKHHPGSFFDARSPECSTRNEAQTWVFEGASATLVVRQITGAIARRIVPWSKVGDTVRKGERFGMIRFGSRTEVFVPMECEILVRPGDKVKGGSTILALLPEASGNPVQP